MNHRDINEERVATVVKQAALVDRNRNDMRTPRCTTCPACNQRFPYVYADIYWDATSGWDESTEQWVRCKKCGRGKVRVYWDMI